MYKSRQASRQPYAVALDREKKALSEKEANASQMLDRIISATPLDLEMCTYAMSQWIEVRKEISRKEYLEGLKTLHYHPERLNE